MAGRALILAFIFGCIGMQVHAHFAHWKHFPFIDYTMYCGARYAPVATTRTSLHVRMADGRRVPLPPEYMGLHWHAFWGDLARPLSVIDDVRDPDGPRKRAAAAARITEQVRRREGEPPVRIEIDVQQYRLVGREIHTGIGGRHIDLPYDAEGRS